MNHETDFLILENQHLNVIQNLINSKLNLQKQDQHYSKIKHRQVTLDYVSKYKIPLCNHLKKNYHITNKKALFLNLENLYEFKKQDLAKIIPQTYFVDFGNIHQQISLIKYNYEHAKLLNLTSPIFIVKPGEDSNRGNGIEIVDNFEDLKKILLVRQFH